MTSQHLTKQYVSLRIYTPINCYEVISLSPFPFLHSLSCSLSFPLSLPHSSVPPPLPPPFPFLNSLSCSLSFPLFLPHSSVLPLPLSLSFSLSLNQVGKYTTTAEGIEAEPHPLWEYPAYARSDVAELLTFDLTNPVPEKATLKVEGEIVLNDFNKPCHGVALWMEYHLTDSLSSSGGLLKVKEERRGRERGREREGERERERERERKREKREKRERERERER